MLPPFDSRRGRRVAGFRNFFACLLSPEATDKRFSTAINRIVDVLAWHAS